MMSSRGCAHPLATLFFALFFAAAVAGAQQTGVDSTLIQTNAYQTGAADDGMATSSGSEGSPELPDAPGQASGQQQTAAPVPPPPPTAGSQNSSREGKQTKRILNIVPNFNAVSTDEHLPPQSPGGKFKTAAQDSFDYSSFIFVGLQAGVGQWEGSYPEFHQGAAGYGRYYWHTFADDTDENIWVEFILPTVLHQDIRYYTLGRGRFGKRLVYAVSRFVITRNDAGNETFNSSEVFGAGIAAGISNLYYPAQERTETKTYQRWVTNISLDDAVFVLKEFWPDINNKLFHQKD